MKPNARTRPRGFTNSCEYIVWASKGPLTKDNTRKINGYIQASSPATPKRIHQTQKPIDVMTHLLAPADPALPICDPFAGGATTLIAALESGINSIGTEKHPGIAAAAAQRLHHHTTHTTT